MGSPFALGEYGDSIAAPIKFGVLNLVVIKANYTSSGTTVALDEALSSPGTTITRDGAGQFTITFPEGQFVHPVGLSLNIAEPVAGNFIDWEGVPDPSTSDHVGSAVFETSQTKGTAADPTGDCSFYATLLVGSF